MQSVSIDNRGPAAELEYSATYRLLNPPLEADLEEESSGNE